MKKIIWILVSATLLFVAPLNSYSLRSGIDVYTKQLASAKSDSQRVSLYDKLAMQYIQLDFSKTIEYSNKAIELAHSKNLYFGEMKAIINFAEAHIMLSHYDEASRLLYSAYYKAESAADSHSLAKIDALIGNMLFDLQNYDEAELYFNRSLDICLKNKYYRGVLNSYTFLGKIKLVKSEYSKCETLIKTGLEFKNLLKSNTESDLTYLALGECYTKKRDYVSSLACYDTAFKYAEIEENWFLKASINIGLGNIEKQKGNFTKAIDFYNKAISTMNELEGRKNLMTCYKNLSECYFALNDLKNAYANQLLYEKSYAQMFNGLQIANLIRKQASYDKERIRAKLENSESQNILKAEENIRQRYWLYSIAFLFFLVLVFATMFLKSNKKLKSANSRLSDSLEEIHIITVELEQRKYELEESNKTKDKFISIIAHDLRNPVSGMMSLTKHLIDNLEKVEPNLLKSSLGVIEKAAYQSFSLLENLLQWSRSQSDTIEYYPEYCELFKVVDRNISLIKASADNKNISFTNKVDEKLNVLADLNMLSTVIRNLIANAVKFTAPGGSIEIGYNCFKVEGDEFANIYVKDTGVGISPENLEALFSLTTKTNTKGTKDESGSGLGLILCKEFIEKMGGEIFVKSQVGVGSEFSFYLATK